MTKKILFSAEGRAEELFEMYKEGSLFPQAMEFVNGLEPLYRNKYVTCILSSKRQKVPPPIMAALMAYAQVVEARQVIEHENHLTKAGIQIISEIKKFSAIYLDGYEALLEKALVRPCGKMPKIPALSRVEKKVMKTIRTVKLARRMRHNRKMQKKSSSPTQSMKPVQGMA